MYGERYYGRRQRDEPTEVKDDGRLTHLEFCWFGSTSAVPRRLAGSLAFCQRSSGEEDGLPT